MRDNTYTTTQVVKNLENNQSGESKIALDLLKKLHSLRNTRALFVQKCKGVDRYDEILANIDVAIDSISISANALIPETQ